MTDSERARLEAAEAAVAEFREILPALTDAYHAQSAQSGEQTAQAVAVDRELARLARAIDYPTHLDAERTRIADTARRVDALESRPAEPSGLAALWTPIVTLALTVADFLGLRKKPWLALLYILIGLSIWGLRTLYRDADVRRAILGKLDAQGEGIDGVQAGLDSLNAPTPKQDADSLAADAP